MAKKKLDSTRFKYIDYTVLETSQILNPITIGPWQSKKIILNFFNLFFIFLFKILVDSKGLMHTNLLSFTWWDQEQDENISEEPPKEELPDEKPKIG